MDDKKIFDVAPPKTAESVEAAKTARKMLLSSPELKPDEVTTAPEIESSPKKTIKPRAELTITPPSEVVGSEEPTAPEVTDIPKVINEDPVPIESAKEEAPSPLESTESETKDSSATTEPKAPVAEEPPAPEKEPESADSASDEKDEPIKELVSFDSIVPDTSQRAATTAKDAMQSPTMYDTKAYYVPIGNSHHKHGHVLGAVLAGIITAVVVAGAVFAAAKFL